MEKLTRRLNHIALAGLLLVGLSTPSWADPVAPCAHDSLQNYMSLGSTGCTIGNLRFFDFLYPPPQILNGAPLVPAAAVAVHPISGPDKGFTFAAEWYSTFTGELRQSLLYSVEDLSNLPSIVGATLSFEGYAGVALSPFARVEESICLGGLFVGLCSGIPAGPTMIVSFPTTPQASLAFGGTQFMQVLNTVHVFAGVGGQAEVEEFTNTFSQVPEPGLLILVGLGASGLAARRRRRLN